MLGGTGGFDNTNGQMSAAYSAVMSLANMAWDPSAASGGGIYAGGQLSMSVGISLSAGHGMSTRASASITALNGAVFSGAVNSTGVFSLASNGVIQNFGQIVGGSTVNVIGGVSNAANARIHADGDLNIVGGVVIAGRWRRKGTLMYPARGSITRRVRRRLKAM